ncbi:MAG: hypothetical protein Q7W56_00405 [Candidatus Latescibacteria bacterium]|nr:hypothetical protein [Candidatus Latescibacterota bacterium]
MNLCKKFLCAALLAGACVLVAPARAAAPAFATKVAGIESAQAAELARLGEAIAAAADPVEVLALQRCAVYVKAASRLALHQARLESAVDDSTRADLAVLVGDLRARLEVQKTRLPADYVFAPLATAVREVPPCAE